MDQIVGPDREEISLGGERVGGERGAGNLEHRTQRRQRFGERYAAPPQPPGDLFDRLAHTADLTRC